MKTQLIEKTAKRYKAQTVLASLMMIVGGVWVAVAMQTDGDKASAFALFFTGLAWRGYVKLAIWWHHE